jgi:single-strand DNA-binding protein
MTDTIAISGIVATPPNLISKTNDLKIVSFRLASTQRRFDRGRDRWIDGETNWYSVTAFRQLALNVESSVVKGDKVIVTGRLRVRDWDNGEKKGTNVDIEATSIGHDLAWGTTTFTRVSAAAAAADEPAAESEEAFPSEIDVEAPSVTSFEDQPATAPF